MEFGELMEDIARVFEVVGVAIIVVGGGYALIHSIRVRPGTTSYFEHARRGFGRPLILGLEVLIAADIIKTITVDLTLESVTVLGILVVIRVVLSFALDIEIDGMFPWRRAQYEASLGSGTESKG
jgi:uncharacterized membrane protein